MNILLKWASVFSLGYLCASNQIFSVLRETTLLSTLLVLCGSFLLIYWPLDMIAQQESIQNPMTSLRTSARDHLQRRGSF